MLGWAMKRATGGGTTAATPGPGENGSAQRALEVVTDPNHQPDDTFIEQPNTPAPVFAARAFKHALFGTPAANAPKEKEAAAQQSKASKPANTNNNDFTSPTKPAGILLTPGTGTTRRKRVSFGGDVKANPALGATEDGTTKTRPRSKLIEALENSRRQKTKTNMPSDDDHARKIDFDVQAAEEGWEEVEELDRDPDITVDLNEPRSQSGRYWKSQFNEYHEQARVEMDKLIRYKQLAKSYAKAKDNEALDLHEKLKEEQEKVQEMEQQLAEFAGTVASKRGQGTAQEDRELAKELKRQKALAAEYKDRVQELEDALQSPDYETDERSQRRRTVTSPRTAKTLLETQRELRKARDQVKELNELRQEVQRLKSDLSATEQRELKVEVEKKKIAADLSKSTSRVTDLERRLKKAEDDCQRKDNQYKKLREDYDAVKEKNRLKSAEAREELQRKNEEIAEVKRESRMSKPSATQHLRDDLNSLTISQDDSHPLTKKLEDLQAKLKVEQEARRREMEDASVTINKLQQEFRSVSNPRPSERRRAGNSLRGSKSSGKISTYDNEENFALPIRVLADKKQSQTPPRQPSNSRRELRKSMSGELDADRNENDKPRNDDFSRLIDIDRLAALERETQPRPVEPDRPKTRASSRGVGAESRARPSKVPEDIRAMMDKKRISSSDSDDPQIDLLESRFRKLGGAVPDTSIAWTAANASKAALPADRRAAAIARIEQKRMERKKAQESTVMYSKKGNLRI